MILTCPSCGTQYVVKDGAVPPQGRQVRCAACKHSWHQDPDPNAADGGVEESASAAQPAPEMEAVTESEPSFAPTPLTEQFAAVGRVEDEPAAEEESFAEATIIEPRSGPEAEQRAYEEAVIADVDVSAAGEPAADKIADTTSPPEREPSPMAVEDEVLPTADENGAAATFSADYDAPPAPEPGRVAAFTSNYDAPPTAQAHDDEFSPFAERERAEPRGRSAVVSIAMLVVAIAVLAAAFWFLAPAEWRARVGLGDVGKTPLELMITHPDRQKLASGQESLTISGRVINPTDGSHTIPPIYAQLKSRTGKTIYSWTIAPPAPSLGPRASASFNSTEVDVPPGGDDLTISLGSPKP